MLAPGHCAVVVYNWRSLALKAALLPARLAAAPWRLVRKIRTRFARRHTRALTDSLQQRSPSPPRRLYIHAHSYRWFARQDWPFPWQVRVWRSVSVSMLCAYFHGWLFGRTLLAILYRVEGVSSRLMGRWGAYPMILITKPRDTAEPLERRSQRNGRQKSAA